METGRTGAFRRQNARPAYEQHGRVGAHAEEAAGVDGVIYRVGGRELVEVADQRAQARDVGVVQIRRVPAQAFDVVAGADVLPEGLDLGHIVEAQEKLSDVVGSVGLGVQQAHGVRVHVDDAACVEASVHLFYSRISQPLAVAFRMMSAWI